MTPETDNSALTPAPLWRRIAAIVYDTFLVIALLVLVGFINLGIQMAIFGEDQLRQMTKQGVTLDGPLFYMAILLTIFGFFSVCWTKKGQTLGMQAWRICIVSDNGHPISLIQALQRFLVAIPSLCLAFAGLIWIKVDPQQKSWQDKASCSRTVLLQKHV